MYNKKQTQKPLFAEVKLTDDEVRQKAESNGIAKMAAMMDSFIKAFIKMTEGNIPEEAISGCSKRSRNNPEGSPRQCREEGRQEESAHRIACEDAFHAEE